MESQRARVSLVLLLCAAAVGLPSARGANWDAGSKEQASLEEGPKMGSERVVFQTAYGDIEFGFYPEVAPITAKHMAKLARMGCFTTNHFFRVDRGFVAQVADVVGGRTARLNAEQEAEARRSVPGEFSKVKHTRGILSMGRYDDPNSATSSFSILLGNAPHLDGQYAVFGKMTAGDEVLKHMETLPTRTEGIFVMPVERITILSTYVYDVAPQVPASVCDDREALLRRKLVQAEADLQDMRRRCLP